MAMKYQKVAELLDATILDITKDTQSWEKFLNTVANVYRYPFKDQVLIYTQKPNAVAVADITVWNKSMLRLVKRGTKGIALIDDASKKEKLRYVFEYNDTWKSSKNSKDLNLWVLDRKYEKEILEDLEKVYINTNPDTSFEDRIYEIVEYIANECYIDEADKLVDIKEEFNNEEILSIRSSLRNLMTSSMFYCILKRCGIDTEKYESMLNFDGISNFNTLKSVTVLGESVSSLTEPILQQIGKTIRIKNKSSKKILDNNSIVNYNKIENEDKTERGNGYGRDNIHRNGRLLDTGFNDRRRGGRGERQEGLFEVRRVEEEVSQGTEDRNLYRDSSIWGAVRPPMSDRPGSKRDGREIDRADEEIGRNNGINEEYRPDGMGTSNEQYKEESRRNSSSRSYIQLDLFPTIKQQEDAIEKIGTFVDEKSAEVPIFIDNIEEISTSISLDAAKYTYLDPKIETNIPHEYVVQVLKRGSGFEGGKSRIRKMYEKDMTNAERAKSIKKEYGLGGSGWPVNGYGLHGYDSFKGKGLRINWKDAEGEKKGYISWNDVEKEIGALILSNEYIEPKIVETEELKLYTSWGDVQPIVRCVWSEYNEFEENTLYSLQEFNRMMLSFDEEVVRLKTEAEAQGEYHPYYKTKFQLIYPDGTIYEDRQDIGDGDGDLIDHIAQSKGYDSDLVKSLRKVVKDEPLPISEEQKSTYLEKVVRIQPEITNKYVEEHIESDNTVASGDNYKIVDFNLGKGSLKEKFRDNIVAIRLLKNLEEEDRVATPEEQKILSNYVGWGGLSKAFDKTESSWNSEYNELLEILTNAEYISARESTLNSHYTDPVIIQSIYKALSNMGFSKGNILEPSMGVGNFFGMLPEEMKDSNLYGVELDDISGRIAKKLYPKANITIKGYEKTDYPNDFFDIAIGNVPFGNYKIVDKKFDKYNFQIHDYFFAKTIDQIRPGGIIAFVTSKGTMDKSNGAVRKYISERAKLLGAIRLPNTAFKSNAGTEVTSDIIFLQKRDRPISVDEDWIYLNKNDEDISINQYFIDNPQMILGKMEMVSGPFGPEATCIPLENETLDTQLNRAIENIKGNFTLDVNENEFVADSENAIITANLEVRNYSYTIVDDNVYYRENSIMKLYSDTDNNIERIKKMVVIRDCTRKLIDLQLEDYEDQVIKEQQVELNRLYDEFYKKYGVIQSKTNKKLFNDDSSYSLLCSLEELDAEGNLKCKASMFTKRTIKKQVAKEKVDTSIEALACSLSEKTRVDISYMSKLTDKSEEEVVEDLVGIIFQNPITKQYENSDEYLSGNVKEKLETAKIFAENDSKYNINIQALEKVQPQKLEAADIDVRIGATWIDKEYIDEFMMDVFNTPRSYIIYENIKTHYSDITGEWSISGKSYDKNNVNTSSVYGTDRVNAYKILEDSLNLRDTRVFDRVEEDGKMKSVLNKKETLLASQKQDEIREKFKEWIFENSERRDVLCNKYNNIYNTTRPREYDGSHLTYPGMSPDIELKEHQNNAVARILYGNNTLLAHCVGAGKTFEMTAAAMESKRLGLSNKALFVVPNHLTEQWASDFLQLYPGANILAATKKDFEPANRKKFCARIATGDYDAIIIGHSQFEKIPLSKERQALMISQQIEEVTLSLESTKEQNGERYTIKQLEKTRKILQARLEKLNDDSKKDDVVTFEELGVDRLFVDEAHSYKNLFLYTKMRRVAGIAQTEAKKSSDMFAKCQYMDEITNGKGIVFATGTPISNSMTELYTMMRYLQYNTLQRLGLGHFDSWAATFGETVTSIELAPEGTGYRAKTRFAKFFNLPELISIFKEAADIQTADMLKLPIPKAKYNNVVLKPSEEQKNMIEWLAKRAENVRNRVVEPYEDNMLTITNDGRKIALDQRLVNNLLPDSETSKTTACVENAYNIYKQHMTEKAAQLIFCDLSTPKGDGSFNIYDDIKNKLMTKGVPEKEIAFIHDANTEIKKAELFKKVRQGKVRFLLGSTGKMGAGTNVQERLIALHHLDVPWKPSDIEQQEGRILRQGNINEEVQIFRYITENTFDAYSWQLIENKQRFISQIMTSKSPVRSCEDIDEAVLTTAEVKALATGNPYIKEKMDLDIQVAKLKLLRANHKTQKYRLEDSISKTYPKNIRAMEEQIEGMKKDIELLNINAIKDNDNFKILISGNVFTDKKEAGAAIIDSCRKNKTPNVFMPLGEYLNYKLSTKWEPFDNSVVLQIKNNLSYTIELGSDPVGNITRINNALESLPKRLEDTQENIKMLINKFEDAKIAVLKPFDKEQEYQDKTNRLNELNKLLDMSLDKEVEQTTNSKGQSTVTFSCGSNENITLVEALKSLRRYILNSTHSPNIIMTYCSGESGKTQSVTLVSDRTVNLDSINGILELKNSELVQNTIKELLEIGADYIPEMKISNLLDVEKGQSKLKRTI